MRLERLPSAYLVGIFGRFGSGKSLTAIEQAVRLADYYHKPIVSNVRLRPVPLLRYCQKFGFNWLAGKIEADLIRRKLALKIGNSPPPYRFIRYHSTVTELLNCEDSIILFDEGAIGLFSRDYRSPGRSNLISRMVRVRHYGNVILLVSQNDSQIDKQFRLCFDHVIFCDSFTYKGRLQVRRAFLFDNLSYEEFRDKFRTKIFTPIWKSGWRFIIRPLFLLAFFGDDREKYLFKIYDSFDGRKIRKRGFIEYTDSSPSPSLNFLTSK